MLPPSGQPLPRHENMIVLATIKKVIPANPKLANLLKPVQMNNSQLSYSKILHMASVELDRLVYCVLVEPDVIQNQGEPWAESNPRPTANDAVALSSELPGQIY